jgi:hypothetical protein
MVRQINDIAAEAARRLAEVETAIYETKCLFLNPLNTVRMKVSSAYGIASLKQIITFLGAQVQASFKIDTNGDGKTSTSELASFAFGAALSLPALLPAFSQVGAEVRDLDGDEFNDLISHIIGTDFLPDDRERAEHYAKSLLFMLNANRQFVAFSVQFFKGADVRFEPTEGLL